MAILTASYDLFCIFLVVRIILMMKAFELDILKLSYGKHEYKYNDC